MSAPTPLAAVRTRVDPADAIDERLARRLAGFAQAAALMTMAVGLVVLFGWFADVPALKSVLPHLPTMKANTALGFLGCGAALWLLHPACRVRRAQDLGALLACIPLAIGLATMAEYLGWNLAIDELLVRDDVTAAYTSAPGRPSPITAVAFALLGSALVALRFEPRGARLPSQFLAASALVVSSLGFLGYLYGAALIRTNPAYTTMALHTALTFIVVTTGVMCARPDQGMVRQLTHASAGGLLARWLIPSVIVFTVTLGWLRLHAQRAGLIDTELGLVIMVIVTSAFVIVATSGAARTIDRLDRAQIVTAHRLSMAVRAGGIGIWDWDLRSNALLWDEQMYEFYGIEPGRPVDYATWAAAVLPEDLAAAESVLQETIRTGQPSDNHFRIVHPRRGVRHIAASEETVVDRHGAPVRMVGVNRDVTEQMEQAARLRASEERAVAASRELEAFSYSVAHDLRAPLRAINGFSQILQMRHAAQLNDDARECLGQICESSRRMGQLIDDLLSLSKVGRADLVRKDVDLSRIVHTIAERLQKSAPGRAVEFVIQDAVTASGDERLLQVALENLIGNAWKYTGKHEKARIEFGAARAGDHVEYFVRDDGDGFDMAYAGKLFGPFQRLHLSADFEGSGIGLATVQRVIQRHGGTVRGEGEVGAGATFTFTLS